MGLANEWIQRSLDELDLEVVHRPVEEEYSFYHAVKAGDMAFVQQNCDSGAFTSMEGMGVLSKNPLTNIKYHFVITVALVARQCIEGGMPLEHAYRLSDFYISKLDNITKIEDVVALHRNMSLDYTRNMLKQQKNPIVSKPILECTDYIYSHLHERITVNELAEHTHLSTSYLSKLFKTNMNISVSGYIIEQRLDLAENMLKYSDLSYSEIANYLAFATQSHFIQVFKKKLGITPKQYRDAYYHTIW